MSTPFPWLRLYGWSVVTFMVAVFVWLCVHANVVEYYIAPMPPDRPTVAPVDIAP